MSEKEQKPTEPEHKKTTNPEKWKALCFIVFFFMIGTSALCIWLMWKSYDALKKDSEMNKSLTSRQMVIYQDLNDRFSETKSSLDVISEELLTSRQKLSLTKKELATVQALYDQSQLDVKAAKKMAKKLEAAMKDLEKLHQEQMEKGFSDLNNMITTLKEQNSSMVEEMADLKKELSIYEADISNLDEGKGLLELFKSKIHLVKRKMTYLKREARLARIEAQRQRDYIETINGNGGFLIKDGASQSTQEQRKRVNVEFIDTGL